MRLQFHTLILTLTQQRKLMTTPLNSRPTNWTMWTPGRPNEQCELQTIPLNNVNCRPLTEQCELWTSQWTLWTMLNDHHPTTIAPPSPHYVNSRWPNMNFILNNAILFLVFFYLHVDSRDNLSMDEFLYCIRNKLLNYNQTHYMYKMIDSL